MTTALRCHRLADGSHVPGCYGAALDGPEACTCETLEGLLDNARARERHLRHVIRRLRRNNDELRARIRAERARR